MRYPVDNPVISCDYNLPRPTEKDPNRKHSAVDYARKENGKFIPLEKQTKIFAPEDGKVYTCCLKRKELGTYQDIYWSAGKLFAFRNYFEDWAGTFICLVGVTYTHLFLHCEFDIMFNFTPGYFKCYSTKKFFNMHTLAIGHHVKEGEHIGFSGNSGKSFGEHIHNEIHFNDTKGYPVYTPHGERPNPEEIYGG